MKYKDNFRHMKGGRDKYNNKIPQPLSQRERQERQRQQYEKKVRRRFVARMYQIDKHWVQTLTEEEMETLYDSWNWNKSIQQMFKKNTGGHYFWFGGGEGDGGYNNLTEFVKAKKESYGNSIKARELKIDELFSE